MTENKLNPTNLMNEKIKIDKKIFFGFDITNILSEIKRILKEIIYSIYRRFYFHKIKNLLIGFLILDSKEYNYTIESIHFTRYADPEDYYQEPIIEIYIPEQDVNIYQIRERFREYIKMYLAVHSKNAKLFKKRFRLFDKIYRISTKRFYKNK
jgi:hypothetical protein